MPSRAWYWIAAAIFAAGAAGAAWFLTSRLAVLEDELIRIVVPGTAEVMLAAPGDYTIFHESVSVVDDRLYNAESVSGLAVELRAAGSGRPVGLTQPGATTSYSLGGRSGSAVFGFQIAEPGVYRVVGAYADGRGEPQTVLAIGQGFVGRLFATIGGALGIGLAAFGIATVIATVTFLRRRRSRRAAVAAGIS